MPASLMSKDMARALNFQVWSEILVEKFEKMLTASAGAATDSDSLYFLKTEMPVAVFMERMVRYLVNGAEAPISFETFACAGVLMKRWEAQSGAVVTRENFFRVLFAAMLAAIKTREDFFENNAYYALVWGMDAALANVIEADFLQVMDWDLSVSQDAYDEFMAPPLIRCHKRPAVTASPEDAALAIAA